jgi:hypothetical protein
VITHCFISCLTMSVYIQTCQWAVYIYMYVYRLYACVAARQFAVTHWRLIGWIEADLIPGKPSVSYTGCVALTHDLDLKKMRYFCLFMLLHTSGCWNLTLCFDTLFYHIFWLNYELIFCCWILPLIGYNKM